MQKATYVLTCAMTLAALAATPAAAQVIHVPPSHRFEPPTGKAALRITKKTPAAHEPANGGANGGAPESNGHGSGTGNGKGNGDGTHAVAKTPAIPRVHVVAGELLVTTDAGVLHRYGLNGRSIKDVVDLIVAVHGEQLVATTDHPGYPAAALLPLHNGADIGDNGLELFAAEAPPLVRMGFGLVMSLASADKQEDGLLTQAGFQFDIIGDHRLRTFTPAPDSVTGLMRIVKEPLNKPFLFRNGACS